MSVDPAGLTNIHKYFLIYGQVHDQLYLTIFADCQDSNDNVKFYFSAIKITIKNILFLLYI